MSQTNNTSGVIFVMIGPGGAGKNAIMKAIIAQSSTIQIRQLATATTRPMRDGEKQGREHIFVSSEEFKELIENDELLEYQEVTPNKFYGIPKKSIADIITHNEIRIADIEVLGAQELVKAFPHNVVQIYVTVPGETLEDQLGVLETRMRYRDDGATDIEERLERAKNLELPYQAKCDYIVVNDELEHAIQLVHNIIHDELKTRDLIGAHS